MYNPNEIYHALVKSGEEYADVKAAYLLLDSMTKTCLSDAFTRTPGKSDTARRLVMYSDKIYIEHLNILAEARRTFLIAEVRYKAIQALADAKRTEASTRRAEAQYISMQEG